MSKSWRSAPPHIHVKVASVLEALDEHVQHVQTFVASRLRKTNPEADAAKRLADETWPRVWLRLSDLPLNDETAIWVANVAELVTRHMGWGTLRELAPLKTGEEHALAYQVRQNLATMRGQVAVALDEWRNPIPQPPDFEEPPAPAKIVPGPEVA